MAKYAINQEGLDAMRKLAADMERIREALTDHSAAMRYVVESRESELGIYGEQLLELLDQNQQIIAQADEQLEQLAAGARRLADKIDNLIRKGLQPGRSSGDGSVGGGSGSVSSNSSGSGTGADNQSLRGRIAPPPGTTMPGLGVTADARLLSKYVNAPYFEGQWARISGEHSQKEDLQKTNPHVDSGLPSWTENCQRCVPVYEMRRRGYDVEALPAKAMDHLARYPFDVWENANVIDCQDNGYAQIQNLMQQWGEGARCQITVIWDMVRSGHTFVAEQVDGQTRFYDPQIGDEDVSEYFSMVEGGRTRVARIDCLKPSKYITECCIGVGVDSTEADGKGKWV